MEVAPQCYKVTSSTKNVGWQPYFPEKFLCDWFAEECSENIAVYTMIRTGVIPFVAAMKKVVEVHPHEGFPLRDNHFIAGGNRHCDLG